MTLHNANSIMMWARLHMDCFRKTCHSRTNLAVSRITPKTISLMRATIFSFTVFDDVSMERDRQTLEHTDCLDSEDGLLASLPNQVGADSNSVLQFTRVMSSEANTLFSPLEAEALPPGESLRLLESQALKLTFKSAGAI